MDPKWKQNCVTDTSFTLIIDNHKHICVHDCPPIVQKSLRSCTQLVINCNNSSLSYALGMFIEQMPKLFFAYSENVLLTGNILGSFRGVT